MTMVGVDRRQTEVDRLVAERTAAAVSTSRTEPDKPPGGTAGLIKRLMARPGIAHLIAAFGRYTDRLGSQFAGAITYFSFLALVPITMVAFAVVGIVLYNRPELVTELANKIAAAVPGNLGEQIQQVINSAISSRYSVGIVGLLIALYSGIGWMGNLREAVRAQWRPTFEQSNKYKDSFIVGLLKNLVNLFGLGVAIVISLALTTAAGTAQSWVLAQLGLDDVGWLKPVFSILTFLIAIGADVVIFYWLYSRIPEPRYRPPSKALCGCARGSRGLRGAQVRPDLHPAHAVVADGGGVRIDHRAPAVHQPGLPDAVVRRGVDRHRGRRARAG